jgi:Uma2 family endonuclease
MLHNSILARRYNKAMIGAMQDVMVFSEQEFEQLPGEGRWEVVDGRAILLPPSEYEHQSLSDTLVRVFWQQLTTLARGFVVSAANVFLPRRLDLLGGFQSRVPDITVSKHKPNRHFGVGAPPELVIEILSTRRGNVERTEKLDDYALAGIGEYWIVNPFDRVVEVYILQSGEYRLQQVATGTITPQEFPGVIIDLQLLWAA